MSRRNPLVRVERYLEDVVRLLSEASGLPVYEVRNILLAAGMIHLLSYVERHARSSKQNPRSAASMYLYFFRAFYYSCWPKCIDRLVEYVGGGSSEEGSARGSDTGRCEGC